MGRHRLGCWPASLPPAYPGIPSPGGAEPLSRLRSALLTTFPRYPFPAMPSPIRQCRITTKDGDTMAPAVWLGQHLAVTIPCDKARLFPIVRGQWVITHRGTGLSAGLLFTPKANAIKIAKSWDSKFAYVTETGNVHNWPHREAWCNIVRGINYPCATGREDSSDSTETASVLAACAGIPIDPAGGSLKIQWRGEFWPAPTDSELEFWTFDSVCETPDGRTVEPDHPESWLRILRLV